MFMRGVRYVNVKFFVLIISFSVYIHVHVCLHSYSCVHTYEYDIVYMGCHRKTGFLFSLSTMWILGPELRFLCFVASTFIYPPVPQCQILYLPSVSEGGLHPPKSKQETKDFRICQENLA